MGLRHIKTSGQWVYASKDDGRIANPINFPSSVIYADSSRFGSNNVANSALALINVTLQQAEVRYGYIAQYFTEGSTEKISFSFSNIHSVFIIAIGY